MVGPPGAGHRYGELDVHVQRIRRPVTAQARAVDDAANIGAAASVTFEVGPQACPCSVFTPATTGNQVADAKRLSWG